jgi:hypothetical protein
MNGSKCVADESRGCVRQALGFRSAERLACALALISLLIMPRLLLAQSNEHQQTSEAEKSAFATGPDVGQKIPYFNALNQNRKLQDFNSIRGPKGAMIVFLRSADW